jgi:hypothetical protein
MKRPYGPLEGNIWIDVVKPRKYFIGDRVIGKGPRGKYDGKEGTLIRSLSVYGGIHQGYYIIKYDDGQTRTYMAIKKA